MRLGRGKGRAPCDAQHPCLATRWGHSSATCLSGRARAPPVQRARELLQLRSQIGYQAGAEAAAPGPAFIASDLKRFLLKRSAAPGSPCFPGAPGPAVAKTAPRRIPHHRSGAPEAPELPARFAGHCGCAAQRGTASRRKHSTFIGMTRSCSSSTPRDGQAAQPLGSSRPVLTALARGPGACSRSGKRTQ